MNDTPKLSEPFTQMAGRIERNAQEQFGGAFVIIPPAGAGDPMQALMLTSTDPAQFWIMLQGQIQKALEALQQQPNNLYGRR
jgi:superfamily II RNA helicase